jgi:phenylpropionate dioxygenase-like ring-hydroxylating dioxygenase large terminal subunit
VTAAAADLVQTDRVDSAIYTSRDIFDEEMERIFHRWWVYVGHESEVPEPGDYVQTWIGLQPTIMSRGRMAHCT